MLLSKCAVCSSKKLTLIKLQQSKCLLSNFTGVKIPILNDLFLINTLLSKYKTNATVNKLLLAGDRFMSEMHLKQPGFTYNGCAPFTKKTMKE